VINTTDLRRPRRRVFVAGSGKILGMRIRRALIEDATEIADVHVKSWRAAYDGVLPNDYLDGLDPTQRIPGWERILSASSASPAQATLVAQVGPDIVGFVSVCPARDSDQNPELVGEVASIYLTKEAWGLGTGRSLMAAALETMTDAGLEAAYLWVLVHNHRARTFYEAGGWRADGAVKTDELASVTFDEVRYRRALS
jgi:GNAT superfamily N-acetyltransferase